MEQLPELVNTAKHWMQSVGQAASEICDGTGTARVVSELFAR